MVPIREVTVQKEVPARMRDGATLMSNVYRPAAGDSYPVLLARMPYGKDLPFNATYLDSVRAARRGYIVAIQDVRGRYASEGMFTPFVREFEDGYDAVEWPQSSPAPPAPSGRSGPPTSARPSGTPPSCNRLP
jgi:predicted acyl esterase